MKKFLILITIMLGFLIPSFVLVTPVFADDAKTAACTAIGGKIVGDECTSDEVKSSPEDLVASVINIFSWVVGAIAVVMLIFGGFRYITSGGDSGKITSAKNVIIYALIGLVIVALSQLIVNFVLNRTGDAVKNSTQSQSAQN